MSISISRAENDERSVALRLLFSRFPVEEQAVRLREALASAEVGKLNLEGLYLATSGHLPVGAALMMLQADGVALVWPPVVSCGAEDVAAVESSLMNAVCDSIDQRAVKLGQALLSPDDEVEAALLTRHGFSHVADLFFLARLPQPQDATISEKSGQSSPMIVDKHIARESYRDDIAHRFATVIEQSYIHSLDCPYLKDFRSGAEALASHKLSGEFDPASWWIYSIDNEDAGVLLLSHHSDQNATELVYLGVTPASRGLGLGRRMMFDAVQFIAQRHGGALFLAVDCDNRYANSLYAEFSFTELARRRIMIRSAP